MRHDEEDNEESQELSENMQSPENSELVKSLNEGKDPEEFLTVKASPYAWADLAELMSTFVTENHWDISGNDDGERENMMWIVGCLGDAQKNTPPAAYWTLMFARKHVTIMYDLLRQFVRDGCWSEYSGSEDHHGYMVGAYANIYHALDTSEAA